MNGHSMPELFDPATEEEIEEQERRDAEEERAYQDMLDAEAEAERMQMEERDNEIAAQIYGTSESSGCYLANCAHFSPHAGTYTFCEAHRPKTSAEWQELYESYECDSHENLPPEP